MSILDYANKCMDEMPADACSCGFDDVSFPHKCSEERAKMQCKCGYFDASGIHSCETERMARQLTKKFDKEKKVSELKYELKGELTNLFEVRGMLHALCFIEEDSGKYEALHASMNLLDAYIQEQLAFIKQKEWEEYGRYLKGNKHEK